MIRRLLPLLIFLALAGLLGVGIVLSRNPDRQALPSTLIGKPAPGFALPLLDPTAAASSPARIVHSRELAGKPYVLNVWGSWCVNCREEHPVVSALSQRGVKVVGYNYHDDPDDARRWLAQFGNPYSLIVADVEGRTALDWGIYGAPETYLVDAHGIVRWKHVGELTPQLVDGELLPLLRASGGVR
ncbi:MAG: DsbE family thiol:disulfide interchange protein [Proteobacteria bacterium]|nr:DsbE family thiol:disulfide interchange protein [Pseudomonadota bacterium]